MSELIIELKQLYFYSFHGLYAEEKKTGGEFVVDLLAKYTPAQNPVTDIEKTVNYASLYEIVKEQMRHPEDLLETIAMLIAEKIHYQFRVVREVEIRIEKKNPPISNFVGSVAVTYRKQF